jgi:hypothetical protein
VNIGSGLFWPNPNVWVGSGPTPNCFLKIPKNLSKNICDFIVYCSIYFAQYWFVFLYRKDTNPVLKYLVFIKTLQKIIKQKKYFVFIHTAKSLKDKKKIITSYFHTTKKIYVLACILALITNLLKP